MTNLHLKSGIRADLLAELHGNVTKLCCQGCGFKYDSFPDLSDCPLCGAKFASSVVRFGDPLPVKDFEEAVWHSRHADLFVVPGSILAVYPAADMSAIALECISRLAIVNQQETTLDSRCQLRFEERVGEVLPRAVARLKRLMKTIR